MVDDPGVPEAPAGLKIVHERRAELESLIPLRAALSGATATVAHQQATSGSTGVRASARGL